jgi:hypothetical protein
MTEGPHADRPEPAAAATVLERGLGRRAFVQAALATGAVFAAGVATAPSAAATGGGRDRVRLPGEILQPGTGPIDGDVYLPSRPEEVYWGYLPRTTDVPVARMRSGQTITIDTVSHEGLLEDQGRNPAGWFAGKGVPRDQVLDDAVAVAAGYDRHPRNSTPTART